MKRIFSFFIIIIIISTLPTNASEITSILQKSVGGEKAVERISSLKSIYMSGTVEFDHYFGTYEYYFKFPNKYFKKYTLPEFTIANGYDGSIAWEQDISGRRTELSGISKNLVLSEIYLKSFSYLFDDSLDNKEYLGVTSYHNANYNHISFNLGNNNIFGVLYDVLNDNRSFMTFAHDLYLIKTNETEHEIIDGIKFPIYTNSFIDGLDFEINQTMEQIEFDIEMHDSLFIFKKRDLANYRFPSQEAITIKFEYQNNHIFLPVTLSGSREVYMLLDSGAGASVINKKIADEINFDSIGTIPAIGGSGITETKLIRTDSLQIGELKLYKQIVGSLDLQNIMRSKINKIEFGGIIGNDFLSQFPVLIDYKKRELTIYNPKNYHAPSGGNKINFEYYMLIPTIECEVASAKGKFIVDLGNSFGLILHDTFVNEHNLKDKISIDLQSKQIIGGIGGAVVGQTGVVDSILLGDETLLDEEIIIPSSGKGIVGSSEIAGNIGNQLLKRFKIFFDYSQNEIILYKNE